MPLRNTTSDIVDSALVSLSAAGLFGLAVAAPNSISAIEKLIDDDFFNLKKRKEARRIARYMRQQKLVNVRANEDGSFTISMTQKGKTRSQKAHLEKLTYSNKSWDNKWRVIMFDIPETHKTLRDYISTHLRRVGFKQIQRSVFVFPYPVDDFLAVLSDVFPEVDNYLIYMTVEDAGNHNSLVKEFSNILP